MRSIPNHVAIIMDRNGAWAKKRFLPRVMGHRAGVGSVKKAVKASLQFGVKYLSLFAFSTENWHRPPSEVSFLMGLLEGFILQEGQDLISKGVRLITSGRRDRLPFRAAEAVDSIIAGSAENSRLILNIALDYGGRDELLHAFKELALQIERGEKDVDSLAEEDISASLYHPELPDVDLLIRTGGEQRISNFMLWRLAYAEMYFPDVLWPDFNEDDFLKALDEYEKRTRRFGKTDEQIKGDIDE